MISIPAFAQYCDRAMFSRLDQVLIELTPDEPHPVMIPGSTARITLGSKVVRQGSQTSIIRPHHFSHIKLLLPSLRAASDHEFPLKPGRVVTQLACAKSGRKLLGRPLYCTTFQPAFGHGITR